LSLLAVCVFVFTGSDSALKVWVGCGLLLFTVGFLGL
jgi:hypothetical protein